MRRNLYTKASRVYHCEHCGEPILPGGDLVIVPGGDFYKLGHEPKEKNAAIILGDTQSTLSNINNGN